jgi:hypothetical protein
MQGLQVSSAHRSPGQCRLGGAVFVDREEIGADCIEGIAQFAFACIERKSQKSDYVAAKQPESQDVIGLLLVI